MASSTRFTELRVSELLQTPVSDLENADLVGWLSAATARAQTIDSWLRTDVREFAVSLPERLGTVNLSEAIGNDAGLASLKEQAVLGGVLGL